MADDLELTIDALAAGGDGVGRDDDGRVTFVPLAAPGDRVRVRVVEQHKRFARGELVEVIAPSPDRVAPACELFGTCGGCQWQHVAREAQLRAKQAIVAHALRRVIGPGAGGMELLPIQAPGEPLGWRRRARLRWVRRRRGDVVLGFVRARSHEIVDAVRCPQLLPAAQHAVDAARELLGPGLYGKGTLAVLAGHAGAVHAAIEGSARPEAIEAWVGSGAVAGVRLGGRTWGAETIELEPGLRGRADAFAQPSLAGNRALCAAVAREAGGYARVVELYAGSGNLTRVLRDAGATRVVAIDHAGEGQDEDAVVRWRRGDVAQQLVALVEDERRFDLAVLDPPRAGAADAVALLPRLEPSRILYVSCDPATLARDLDTLTAAGYRPLRAQPIDLMPQTSHVEVIVTLDR